LQGSSRYLYNKGEQKGIARYDVYAEENCSLFVAFLALMARWLLTLSSYVVAPLMLYIFGCGIYTAYRHTWDQFFILLVAEFICFILFFGATAITEGIGRFSEWLAEL